jgi:hypothetical protein
MSLHQNLNKHIGTKLMCIVIKYVKIYEHNYNGADDFKLLISNVFNYIDTTKSLKHHKFVNGLRDNVLEIMNDSIGYSIAKYNVDDFIESTIVCDIREYYYDLYLAVDNYIRQELYHIKVAC